VGFKDHFSSVAGAYQAFRPSYPPAVFEWLAGLAPSRERALDVGCGSGQASRGLAGWFDEVVAVDPSAEQVARAAPHPRVRYAVSGAESLPLPAGSVDLALAAQAYHWFDHARFAAELGRVSRPGAAFAAITYLLCHVDEAVDAIVAGRLYRDLLGPDWPPERAHVESGYRTLPFPWPELPAPPFEIVETWTLAQFAGYLGTWSAAAAFRARTAADPVALVLPELTAAWGPPDEARAVRWPLAVRAGRVG
jgi:SAM-dependent methyltransferase